MKVSTETTGVREHFAVLDGLRGVAALVVLVGHASVIVLDHSFVARKILAVEFFFMLSGFVVAFAYEARLKRGMGAMEFVCRRAIRLYPMICLGVVAGVAARILFDHDPFSAGRTLSSAFLGAAAIPNPLHLLHGQAFSIDPPEWSVSYEMMVSVAFGVLLFRASSRRLLALVAATGVGLLVSIIAYADHIPFAWHVFGALASFVAGVLLCRLYLSRPIPNLRIPAPVLALLLVAACAAPRSTGPWVDVVSVLVLFPLIVIAGAQARPNSRRLDGWIGELSYPLYILHWPVLVAAKALLLAKHGISAAIVGGSAAAVAASWLAYVAIDKPVRRWLSRRFLSPAKPKP